MSRCVFLFILSHVVITEKPAPTRHIWMIGDEFLDGSANILRKLANQHIFDVAKPDLYIYREYHVEAFHDSEIKYTFNNMIRKVRNNLTAALNKFPTVLPDFVIIMLGNSYIHDQMFIEMEFKTILKRVLNDVTRLLASRREQLPLKVLNLRSTQVFMVRPLPKPAAVLKGDQKFKNTRRYVNQMLDNLSRTCGFKPLNIDEINCSQRILFEKNGSLSEYGKERLWHSISEFIKQKDKQVKTVLQKVCAAVEDASTQVQPDQIELETKARQQPIEEYYTSRHHTQGDPYRTDDRSHRQRGRVNDNWAHSRTDHFDDYHRMYDRASFRDQDTYHPY